MTITSPIHVGIDVSNDILEAAKLVRYLKQGKPKLIVMETTGGYGEMVVWALIEAGLPVALVSSQRVQQYGRAKGSLAKTDQLDAHLLADFGKNIQPRLFVGKSQERRRLSALVGRRPGSTDPSVPESA